ncbi:MAG: hypothetical protein Q8K70_11115 [Bacteroidota bacterium]|nr:hypothetical protein [Bacteroidota bacterium]
MRTVIFLLFISFCFSTCKKDLYDENNRNLGKEYINQNLKFKIIYNVEEIVFDDFTLSSDTFKYQIMKINDTFFLDNLNEPVLRCETYKREKDSMKWEFVDAYFNKLNTNKFEIIENNNRYLKLSFPISDDVYWNSNAFNTENNSMVHYSKIKVKETTANYFFPNVIVIKNDPVNNIVRERYFEEKYAEKIGLIYMNKIYIDKNAGALRGYKIIFNYLKHE